MFTNLGREKCYKYTAAWVAVDTLGASCKRYVYKSRERDMTKHKGLRRLGAVASASLIAFSSMAQGADDDVIEGSGSHRLIH